MIKLTQEKINKALNENGVFTEHGNVNQISMFHVSTQHSVSFIDELPDYLFYDTDTISNVYVIKEDVNCEKQ